MRLADTSFKVVEDEAGDCLGLLTIEDVNGEKAMSVAHRQNVALKDVRVREVHEEYLLVLDDDRQQPFRSYLRGLVCAEDSLH